MATNLASLGHCDSGEFRRITGRAVDAKKTTRMTRTSNAATECITAATQPDPGSVISYSVFGFCCTGARTVGTIDTRLAAPPRARLGQRAQPEADPDESAAGCGRPARCVPKLTFMTCNTWAKPEGVS